MENEKNTLKTAKVPGLTIRMAQNNLLEITNIAKLEKEVWGDQGANMDNISSRLNIFPEGSYVAETTATGQIVGYFCFQLMNDLRKQNSLTWSNITDNGSTRNSHLSNGDYLYCINLSVHHLMNGKKLGAALTSQGYLYMIAERKAGMFGGSRIPMFKSYKKNHPEISAADYAELRRGSRLYDYELNLYHQAGIAIVNAKIMPDFFPDEASLNYGVLVFDSNPFQNSSSEKINSIMTMFINQDFINLKKYAQ